MKLPLIPTNMRRLFPLLLLAILTGCGEAGPIKIEQGRLEGMVSPDGDVSIFKGIPYAAAPVGDLRWRPPQPAAPWEGVRQFTTFGPSCMQNLTRSRPPWTEEFMVQNEASEDCLYLNIWTPGLHLYTLRPVLVYIHGGGFSEGSGEVKMYDGTNLAKKGIVVVTINYRLGVFGFLSHPELAAESEHNTSGNYGLLDQVAALQWVQNNIEAFGGDPYQVTIAGQSAGAASVYDLVASPLTEGLFRGAIMQSGPGALAAFGVRGSLVGSREATEESGARLVEAMGVSDIEALRALPAEKLMQPPDEGSPIRFGPSIDGWFLPEDPSVIFATGQPQDVPLMTGLNADEGSASPTYGKMPADQYKSMLQNRYGENAARFLELYPADTDEMAGKVQKKSARDVGLVALDLLMADRAKTSASAGYVYIFERGIPWPEYPDFGAFHTGEVPYVFDNLDLLDRPWEAIDREIAETASGYWVNFVKTGNPNAEGLPEWPAFEPDNPQFMRIGEKSAARALPEEGIVSFYKAMLTDN